LANLSVAGLLTLAWSNTTANVGGTALAVGEANTINVTITGVTAGDVLMITPHDYPGDNVIWTGYVSNTNIVTVRISVTGAATPASTIYHVRVIG
jgi:hypothetical protein